MSWLYESSSARIWSSSPICTSTPHAHTPLSTSFKLGMHSHHRFPLVPKQCQSASVPTPAWSWEITQDLL